jgi:hypothetical protein
VKNLLFLLAIFLSTGAFAQTIAYSYDEAGNRISRTYLVPLRSVSADKSNPPDSVEVEAVLGELKVTICPNPTKGYVDYPSGWYMLRLYTDEKTIDFKIIKQ